MSSDMHDVFHFYLESYAHRNLKALKSLLSPQMTGFGTGVDENTFEGETFLDLYQREIKQVPKNLIFTINSENYQKMSLKCFIVTAILDVSAEINDMPHTLYSTRMSCIFRKSLQDNEAWQLEHMHFSAPLVIQKTGESAPIEELEKQKKELERLVEVKTRELLSINDVLLRKNTELEKALQEVKTLEGLIPICANCKSFRDDAGYWQSIEEYFDKHSDIKFSHGICDTCLKKLYPDYAKKLITNN